MCIYVHLLEIQMNIKVRCHCLESKNKILTAYSISGIYLYIQKYTFWDMLQK